MYSAYQNTFYLRHHIIKQMSERPCTMTPHSVLLLLLCGICITLLIAAYCRKKTAIHRVCCMELREKTCLLNELLAPFGFTYLPAKNILSSRLDAWQRDFGYRAAFDKTAPGFHMVLDCEPVYFNYRDQTWLIEFWKGQYGINIGAEIGIYQAGSLIPPGQYDKTLFSSVPDTMLFPVSMEVYHKGSLLFTHHQSHWWLTGFRMGMYCEPEDIVLETAVTFPDSTMLKSFIEALLHMGHSERELAVEHLTVYFTFSVPLSSQPRSIFHLRSRISQWKNRIFCSLYHRCTLPFSCTLDQLLYLYYLVPSAFRHMLRFKRNKKQSFPGKGGHRS